MGVNRVLDGAGQKVTIERVSEFYEFLQGEDVDGITNLPDRPRLSPGAAFSVIYVLQEHMNLIPDHFEQCAECDGLFDSENEGDTTDDRSLCEGCIP